jgi:hypothetical protein
MRAKRKNMNRRRSECVCIELDLCIATDNIYFHETHSLKNEYTENKESRSTHCSDFNHGMQL